MTHPKDFYVYVIFRPNGIPCYVGKGRGRRWRRHLTRAYNPHLAAIIKAAGGNVPIVKIRQHLSDDEARKIEIAFIAAISREIHGGPLVNQTDGGDGVPGLSPEIRKMMGRKGQPKGPQSPEHRAAESAWQKGIPKGPMSPKALEARRATIALSGGILSLKGTKPKAPYVRSEIWRNRISAALKNKKKTPEHCAAMAESQRKVFAMKRAFAEMLGAS